MKGLALVVQWLKSCAETVGTWWGIMSGALSIPFALLALFNFPPRLLFAALAYIPLWVLVISQAKRISERVKAKAAAGRASITATIQIPPRTAIYDNIMEAVKECELAIEQNSTAEEISKAERKLAEAVQRCADIDQWHRFRNPDSGDPVGQLQEKVAIGREVMERLRKRLLVRLVPLVASKRGVDLISDALPFGRLWFFRQLHTIKNRTMG